MKNKNFDQKLKIRNWKWKIENEKFKFENQKFIIHNLNFEFKIYVGYMMFTVRNND